MKRLVTRVVFHFTPVFSEKSLAPGLQEQLSFLGTERVNTSFFFMYFTTKRSEKPFPHLCPDMGRFCPRQLSSKGARQSIFLLSA